jgi:hypothetical protein
MHTLLLQPTVDSERSLGAESFNALQIGIDGRQLGGRRALHVFFLRAFGVDVRRWVGWILNPPKSVTAITLWSKE